MPAFPLKRLVVLCGALAAASAFATPATLQNSSVLAGVSDFGTLGSNYATSPGILFDPTGTSNYGVNDFLTPGDPFEGFYITSSGGSWGSNNDEGTLSFASASPTSLSATSASWTSTSIDGALTVTNVYSLATVSGRSAISITTTLTNNTGTSLDGMQFLRTLDPDPDVNAFGSYFTTNSVISNDEACGTGPDSGQTICILTDSTFAHKAGVSGPGWSTSPADYLAGLNAGDGDYAIGIGFDLGSLGAGQSLSLTYDYALGASIGVVTGVPEPETYALMLAGLGLVGFAARRRKG